MCQVSDGVNPATLRGEMGCSMLAREKVFSLSHVSNIAGRSHQRDELRTRLDLMLSISSKIISERYDCVRAPVVSLKLSKECEHGGSLYERIHANSVASLFSTKRTEPLENSTLYLACCQILFFPGRISTARSIFHYSGSEAFLLFTLFSWHAQDGERVGKWKERLRYPIPSCSPQLLFIPLYSLRSTNVLTSCKI